ncbi:hypothetical protein BDV98DRAFT_565150 [Pterulicium gracile]|uniref:Uncharacterized protein n=1 Tax=Pterulicium gracile TaxID=1884261 RepID=A0A5C3QM00_9AGAR|nr:hypothetical protein BDV98DRAFT_565150 [Pterula gracilis]
MDVDVCYSLDGGLNSTFDPKNSFLHDWPRPTPEVPFRHLPDWSRRWTWSKV